MKLLLKAARGKRDLSKLQAVIITDKNGVRRKVYKKIEKPEGKKKPAAKPDMPEMKVGDTVTISVDGSKKRVKVTSIKPHITLGEDKAGKKYKIGHVKPKKTLPERTIGEEFIKASDFTAAKWKDQHFDKRVTPDQAGVDYILSLFGKEGKIIAEKAAETERRVGAVEETISRYRISGEGADAVYSPERHKLHVHIIREFFRPDKINKAQPKYGKAPTFMVLGGRGGSGKSSLNGLVFDPSKYIIVDPDAIKEYLPEYEGWNAGQVHEESSDISKKLMEMAKDLGLNIVLDGTMNNPQKTVKQAQEFKNMGYRVEAHYMFAPPQVSTIRAIERFKTKKGDYSGRFVPLNFLVSAQKNEEAFDNIKEIADDWTFNSSMGVEFGSEPKLISRKNS